MDLNEVAIRFDGNGRIIYSRNRFGLDRDFEEWNEYDERNNIIHYKNSYGIEWLKKYDNHNNEIYSNNNGYEVWYIYDENKRLIYKKDSSGIETFYGYEGDSRIAKSWYSNNKNEVK